MDDFKLISRTAIFRLGEINNIMIFSFVKFFFFTFFSSLLHIKIVTNYVLEWMELKFYDYDGLQPKMTHTKHSWGECRFEF